MPSTAQVDPQMERPRLTPVPADTRVATADAQPTPPPWLFDGETVTGPPQPHPHDPHALVYSPAEVVAHMPANFGGAYRYYSPAQREANGRLVEAAWEMLELVAAVAALDAAGHPAVGQLVDRAIGILSRRRLDTITLPRDGVPGSAP
jgi:hypothetical protein